MLVKKKTEYKTGDTLLYDLKSKKISQHIKLEKGAQILLIGGKHVGKIGTLEEVQGRKIIFKVDKDQFETLRKYAFVIGKDKPEIKIAK